MTPPDHYRIAAQALGRDADYLERQGATVSAAAVREAQAALLDAAEHLEAVARIGAAPSARHTARRARAAAAGLEQAR